MYKEALLNVDPGGWRRRDPGIGKLVSVSPIHGSGAHERCSHFIGCAGKGGLDEARD
jgi:hypothetical protein